MNELKLRLEKYFDEFIVDEIQDISGRDFNFLEQLMSTNINMLFVGDFFNTLMIQAETVEQIQIYLKVLEIMKNAL